MEKFYCSIDIDLNAACQRHAFNVLTEAVERLKREHPNMFLEADLVISNKFVEGDYVHIS